MSNIPKVVSFGNRRVGYGQPVFITFEAGPTHSGLASAKSLIALAAEAGADAVKFQILDPDRLVADRSVMFSYDVLVDRESGATETISEPLYELIKRRALSREQWKVLKAYSDSLGLAFFATVGFEDEIDFLVEIGCDSIKIASADLNHLPLLRQAARTGLCLQIDTGNATIGEVETAIDIIMAEGNENIIIHHCPSGYPARMDGVNLRVIQTLERMFRLPVAFSDHSPGWDMDIAAIALGANLVEKTITEDRATRSVEHIMSLEPYDMSAFVKMVRDLETALGSERRIMTETERTKRLAVRRSAYAARKLAASEVLAETDIEFRRPGYGLPPDRLNEIVGKRLRSEKKKGELLGLMDLED